MCINSSVLILKLKQNQNKARKVHPRTPLQDLSVLKKLSIKELII